MTEDTNRVLKTLEEGQPPPTRMADAQATLDFARRLIDNDASAKRGQKRARVNGLIDGNPPYQMAKLRAAGRAESSNVNWGVGRSYMESGVGAFYDLFSEAPGFFGIRTDWGEEEQREMFSNIMREEADRVLSMDEVWDYNMQQSQWDMVLHGCGPLIFEDEHQVLPRAFRCGELHVPEFTKSDTFYWEACAVQGTYYPPELYAFIKSEKAATSRGWNVTYTKDVIEKAMNIRQQQGIRYDWEFYQQELKNNSMNYYDDAKVCRVVHVFYKEFDGKVTHSIVERDTASGLKVEFLFQSVGRYDHWRQGIHPMYFDRGNGGFHHSVTGLGVKMFGAMEFQNRLICNLADKAFAPKILFKPTSTEATQKFSLAHFGDYAVLPGGFEWQQTGVAGLSNEGLAMNREIGELMQSNLSSYRQQVPQKQGNPVTAREIMYEASQQSSLSKTTFNRYYKQLDQLYAEIARRLCNPNSSDQRAQDFQKRCKKRGVPEQCFTHIEKVEAIRVIGQGSSFMRKQAVDSLIPLASAMPEDGRDALIADKIAAEAGQSAVSRYYPSRSKKPMATEQQERAMNQVADMKVGVPPVIVPSQNPVIFATAFMQAATQSMTSLQQGANPSEVLQFLELCGPAVMAHLKRFANDKTREPVVKQLTAQLKQLMALVDKLKEQVQADAQRRQAQQQQQQAALNDQQLKQQKLQADIQMKTAKTKAQMQQSAEKHQQKMAQGAQSMALSDAKSASQIHLDRINAEHEQALNALNAAHEQALSAAASSEE